MAVLNLVTESSPSITDIVHHVIRFLPLYVLGYFVFGFLKLRYFSPISHYPGPFLASISNLWKFRTSLTKREHLVYYEAHEKYGPVFRNGPNSLSFCDVRAVKKIYGTGKGAYPKDDQFKPPPRKDVDFVSHPPVFFAKTATMHQRQKRKVAPAYAMTSVLQMENQIDDVQSQWRERLDQEVKKGQVFNLSKWVNYMTLDVLSELAYGAAFGLLEQDKDEMDLWHGLSAGFIFRQLLMFVPALGKLLFSWPMNKVVKMPEKTGVGAAFKMANEIVAQREKYGSEKKDLIGAIMASKDTDGTPIHHDQVVGEVMASLVAGADTTANSILGTIGFLIQNPSALKRLRDEVDTAVAKGELSTGVPKFNETQKLSWLDACISESLRLAPSIPTTFPRAVPPGGDEVLPGSFVPGGVTVGINNWVMGRDQKFYGPDANQYKPERWENAEDKKRMKDFDFAFGHGARLCLGKNIAMLELYKALTIFARDYEIKPVDPSHLWREEAKLFLHKEDMMVTISRRRNAKA